MKDPLYGFAVFDISCSHFHTFEKNSFCSNEPATRNTSSPWIFFKVYGCFVDIWPLLASQPIDVSLHTAAALRVLKASLFLFTLALKCEAVIQPQDKLTPPVGLFCTPMEILIL